MNSKVNGEGKLNLASQGEHGVLLTQIMHLTGRVARPYNICVGANPVFALARTSSEPEQIGASR
jgi:hypothetical protein